MDNSLKTFFEDLGEFFEDAKEAMRNQDTDWPNEAAMVSVELAQQYDEVKDQIKKLN